MEPSVIEHNGSSTYAPLERQVNDISQEIVKDILNRLEGERQTLEQNYHKWKKKEVTGVQFMSILELKKSLSIKLRENMRKHFRHSLLIVGVFCVGSG